MNRSPEPVSPPAGGSTGQAARRWRRWAGLALWLGVLCNVACAEPVTIMSTPTALSSTTKLMISYRHQEHSWQTADGAVHLMVNRGAQLAGSLALLSSFDGGLTWVVGPALARSSTQSVSDGSLLGDELSIVYTSGRDEILYATFRYDSAGRRWTRGLAETAFAAGAMAASNPALVSDNLGAVWCAFIVQDEARNAVIQFARRGPSGGWTNPGVALGPTDASVPPRRSARPVLLPGGVGVIFTVGEKIFWSWRSDTWPIDTPWPTTTLFVGEPPFDNDPYASHFSVIADSRQDLHMATTDQGRVLYFRYRQASQTWEPYVVLGNFDATYVQASLSGATLLVVANDDTKQLRAFQSLDGATASYTAIC